MSNVIKFPDKKNEAQMYIGHPVVDMENLSPDTYTIKALNSFIDWQKGRLHEAMIIEDEFERFRNMSLWDRIKFVFRRKS